MLPILLSRGPCPGTGHSARMKNGGCLTTAAILINPNHSIYKLALAAPPPIPANTASRTRKTSMIMSFHFITKNH